MKQKSAIILGSSGLIGGYLLAYLQKDESFSSVKILVRKPIQIEDPKVIVSIVDFNNLESLRSEIKDVDVIYCAIGTTTKKVGGDKIKYRQIDFDIPVNAAKIGLNNGCPKFVIVSSLGANSQSKNFYMKLKGEVEDTLSSLNFPSLLIFQPSLLLGKRKEFRLADLIGQVLFKPLRFLFPSKIRPIEAKIVAKSMIEASKTNKKGIQIYTYKDILQNVTNVTSNKG